MHIRVFTLFLLISIYHSFAIGQEEASLENKLDALVPSLMFKAHIPGLSLAVMSEHSLSFTKEYGLKNKTSKETINKNTIFEAASLTKPVFAYAVCRLVDQGKIDLDTPLDSYWVYKDAQPPNLRSKLTARHILTHSTGFRNWRQPRNSDKIKINFEPGDRFSYSGEGFVYLSKVIEHITGMSIDNWIKEIVFKPLNMEHSTMVWDNDLGLNSALPHDKNDKVTKKYKPQNANAAASLHTTAIDYAKFIIALSRGDHLSPKTHELMISRQQNVDPKCSQCREPNSDPEFKAISWGLGVGLEHSDKDYIWHWGDNGNFKSYFCYSISTGKGLVYFANSHHGLAIRDCVVNAILPGGHPAHEWVMYDQIDCTIAIK